MEKTEEFKKVLGGRQWKMERIFAEAKDDHGLSRARYRGRAKMQIQAYMTAKAQNLKSNSNQVFQHAQGFYSQLLFVKLSLKHYNSK